MNTDNDNDGSYCSRRCLLRNGGGGGGEGGGEGEENNGGVGDGGVPSG